MKRKPIKTEWEVVMYWDEEGRAMIELNGGQYRLWNTAGLYSSRDNNKRIVVRLKDNAYEFVRFV